MQEPEIKYEEVDGRQLCSFCYSITIIDPKECKLLIFEIVRMFYASCLHLDVDEDIRILLVDNDEIIKFYNEKPEIIRKCTPKPYQISSKMKVSKFIVACLAFVLFEKLTKFFIFMFLI